MNKRIIALAVMALFIAGLAQALAAGSAKPESAICPVMGNKIPDVSKAAGKSVYKGKTYYFCCASCKAKFDKDPEKYIKLCAKANQGHKVVSAVCPVLGKKIPDISKAAYKSTYKGKTYYFCCSACKAKFDKNPAKYTSAKKK